MVRVISSPVTGVMRREEHTHIHICAIMSEEGDSALALPEVSV